MQMQLDCQKLQLDQATREVAYRRVYYALARFADRVRHVRVRVADVNGPRGGVDTHCLAEARLASGGHVVAEVVDERVEPAISRAVERLARRVRTELETRRDLRRRRATLRGTLPAA